MGTNRGGVFFLTFFKASYVRISRRSLLRRASTHKQYISNMASAKGCLDKGDAMDFNESQCSQEYRNKPALFEPGVKTWWQAKGSRAHPSPFSFLIFSFSFHLVGYLSCNKRLFRRLLNRPAYKDENCDKLITTPKKNPKKLEQIPHEEIIFFYFNS